MMNQHNTKNIVDALSKFQEEGIAAVKDGNNPFFKSTYATLEDVIKAANEGAKYGLAFTQCVDFEKDIIEGAVVPTMFVRTSLMHKDSDAVITSRYPVVPKNNKYDDSQALGSAITYAKRYALQAIYGLPSEDDDGNSNTHNATVMAEQKRKATVWVNTIKQSLTAIIKNADLTVTETMAEILELEKENQSGFARLETVDPGQSKMLKDHFAKVKEEITLKAKKELGGNDEQSNAD